MGVQSWVGWGMRSRISMLVLALFVANCSSFEPSKTNDADNVDLASKKPVSEGPVVVPASATVEKKPALQQVLFVSNRKISGAGPSITLSSITAEPATNVTYGRAIVSIPPIHRIGRTERPVSSFFGLIREKESDSKHFVIKRIDRFTEESFARQIREDRNSVLLFVHGYNVEFSDAVFRTAQIAFDANYPGTVIAFSWPSAGKVIDYDRDREMALVSSARLSRALRLIAEQAVGRRIYVVAHSLGSQIVMDALQEAAARNAPLQISELVFAAPDVGKELFESKAEEIRKVAGNVTMYASSADKALLVSQAKSSTDRIGYVGKDGPNLVDGVDTIDVTAVGEDMFALNHSTFAEQRAVLDDLGRIIMSETHIPPGQRTPTLRRMPNVLFPRYWMYAL